MSARLAGILLSVAGSLGLVVAGLLHLYTSSKLERMAMIRGEIPGATIVSRRIVELEESGAPGRPVCWIYFESTPDQEMRESRVNQDCAQWSELTVGQEIPVAHLPDDDSVYLPDGIYADAGNEAFDRGLLVVWKVGLGLSGLLLVGGAAVSLLAARKRRHGLA